MLQYHARLAAILSLLVLMMAACHALCRPVIHGERDLRQESVAALIDRLPHVASGDIGYMPYQSGTSFLPLGTSQPGTLLLGQESPVSSDVMRELVRRGAAAVPQLVAHLDDRRPTTMAVEHGGCMGGMFFEDEYDFNARTTPPPDGVNRSNSFDRVPQSHTVTVGDLCFVALGQIVNREFNAVRYQPTLCIMVNSPTHSEVLRKVIRDEWTGLTPERHRQSLVRDFLEPDHEDRRVGACLRLGFYYPELLEPLALRQLAAPRYDVFEVETLVREQLYPTDDLDVRRELVDSFVNRRGDVARSGIEFQLFDDLYRHEAGASRDPARACLIELFGYPATVKSGDRPRARPLDHAEQARFIDALAFFPSPKIDRAVREVLHSTDDDYLATACVKHLFGRGVDADIRQHVQTRWDDASPRRRDELARLRERLGWVPLHRAADEGDPDEIQRLIRQQAKVNARAANGRTALHVAADRGNDAAIAVLLRMNADPNLRDAEGRTAVELAVGRDDTVEMLLANGAEPTDIFTASFAGRSDLVAEWLQKDKSLATKTKPDGETPLHIAARRGQLAVARTLIAHGAEVDAPDSSRFTPMHEAAYDGRRAMVALLLSHKADRSARTWDGKTPATFAREQNHKGIVELLENER